MNSVYDPCPCKSGKKFKFCCLVALKNPNTAAQVIATWPIHTCFVNKNWQKSGLANLAVIRLMPQGDFIAGVYLVDVFCLGVKDAYLTRNMNQQKLHDLMDRITSTGNGLKNISYEDARSIVLGGLAFAAKFGFSPQFDWSQAKVIIEPDRAFSDKFTFGCDGKPFYIAGPYDGPKLKENMKKINDAGGEWMINLN